MSPSFCYAFEQSHASSSHNICSEYGDDLPTKPSESNGIIVMGEKGQATLLTDCHTEEARNFVWDKTVEALKKAGISAN